MDRVKFLGTSWIIHIPQFEDFVIAMWRSPRLSFASFLMVPIPHLFFSSGCLETEL